MIMAGGTRRPRVPARSRWPRACCAIAACDRSCGSARAAASRRALVPAAGIPVEWLGDRRPARQGPARRSLAAPFRLVLRAAGRRSARSAAHAPAACVVGLGGFVPGPGGVAAWLLRRPLVIHEQNAVAGFTNRVLGASRATACSKRFRGASAPASRPRRVGNPVRRGDRDDRAGRASLRGPRRGALRLLVVGGSQGAARLNAVVPHALANARA
jgi:UDP-N-acetylglucosamine--N-acetylmuramyl-(pentapeptide) pyrophosphoryl-undecaprenol N-acetylglucosamine transferase